MQSLRKRLQKFLTRAVEVILPTKGRIKRTRNKRIKDIPIAPSTLTYRGLQITALMEYRSPAVQDLIRSLKYDGSPEAVSLASRILEDFLREEISSVREFSAREVVLIPIPLHKTRERERGFNQIEIVLRKLPTEFHNGTISRISPDMLIRTRATVQQTRLSREKRVQNVEDAFELVSDVPTRAHFILIDDVVTTGATLYHASRPLVASGSKISALALSHS